MSAEALLEPWRAAWPVALSTWSRVVKLSEPRWCLLAEDERREQLTGSFAMIRLVDHVVVISLRQVYARKLADYAVEVLAHEIGHHLYAPGDLGDHARCLARMRAALPGLESEAPMIANMYTDLLINHRLVRTAGLRLAEIYELLKVEKSTRLWSFYQRIYELLWSLPKNHLAPPPPADTDPMFELDAGLGARLIRSYAADWLPGAAGFAALCFPYLQKDADESGRPMDIWLDAVAAGAGGEVLPGGLAELDEDEVGGPLHPRIDPRCTGLDDVGKGAAPGGHQPPPPREPLDYKSLMRAVGVTLSDEDIICQYYRELALPHLVPFPERLHSQVTEPLLESLDTWDVGDPMEEIDWFQSVMVSPVVVPGYTTVRRLYGDAPGGAPKRETLDLYLGVDCSGSMRNPATALSYPVVAGAVLALSALRAGARVKVVLSGEPGRYATMDDFSRVERTILRTLTAYLGTGYTFGIPRLVETFHEAAKLNPTHIVLVTDSDIYMMLGGKDGVVGDRDGWTVAADALAMAGGGSMVLHGGGAAPQQKKLVETGWDVYNIATQADLVGFARDFARKHYARKER